MFGTQDQHTAHTHTNTHTDTHAHTHQFFLDDSHISVRTQD